MAKLIVILGGARSGKSRTAEQMARQQGTDQVLYVATAEATDPEMEARIAVHRRERPEQWQTIEQPRQLALALEGIKLPPVVLIDCVTLWTSNILLDLPEDCSTATAESAILTEVEDLLKLVRARSSTWILVSNEVGMGVVPPYTLGRIYRDALGRANQQIALAADEVWLMVAGIPWLLKGSVGSSGSEAYGLSQDS